MRRIVVTNNVSLDGVMQAPGRADEDPRGGFTRGGWALRYADPLALLDDLRAAGETNAVRLRDRRIPPRALFAAALGALPVEDGRITATLRMAVMTGWAPEPAQR